jgi:hypothetical protein
MTDSSQKNSSSLYLSRRAQRLLSRYFDGEVGWLGRYQAERLLRTSESAQEFFGALDESRSVVAALQREQQQDLLGRHESDGGSEAAWKAVCACIDQEQYAERLLVRGNAKKRFSIPQLFAREWLQPLSWGASGAVVSAAAVLLVVGPGAGGALIARSGPLDVGAPEGVQLASAGTSAAEGAFADRSSGVTEASVSEGLSPPQLLPSSRVFPSRGSYQDGSADFREVSMGGVSASGQSVGEGEFDSGLQRLASELSVSAGEPAYPVSSDTSITNISEAIAAALAARARRESEMGGLPFSSNSRRARRSFYDAGASNFAVGAGTASRQAPRAVEVDWMRSDGRVRVFHDPVEQAAFIWVNPSRAMVERSAALAPSEGSDLVPGSLLGEDSIGAMSAESQSSASSAGF